MEKLTSTKYLDILKFDKDTKEKIVFAKEPDYIVQSNIGLVFGGISMYRRVDEALKLYQMGLLDKIVLSGGIGFLNTDRTTTEALKMFGYIASKGVGMDVLRDIVLEDQSRNTVENVTNTIKMLCDPKNTTFTVITSDFHTRRCTMLLMHYLGLLGNDSMVQYWGVKDKITDIDSWDESFVGKKAIFQELFNLIYYAKSGKIDDDELKCSDDFALKRTKI